jgi:hypothetical protein
LTYVEEKFAGLYGHNNEQLSRFKARLSCAPIEVTRSAPGGSGPSLSKRKKAPAGTGPETGPHEAWHFPGPLRSARTERAAQTTQQNIRAR